MVTGASTGWLLEAVAPVESGMVTDCSVG